MPAIDTAGLDDVPQIAAFVFAQQNGLTSAQVAAHQFRDQIPAAKNRRHESLAEDVAHRTRQPLAHLRLLFPAEHAEDAVDGLWGTGGVERGKYQMACFTGVEHNLRGFAVADFADKNDLGRLPHGGAHAILKLVKIKPQFPLAECGLVGREHKFNRILQRDNMDIPRLVDFVQHGGDGGGLAHARAAGHKDEAVLFPDDVLKHRGQIERLKGWNQRLEVAQHHGVIPVLTVNVDAKPADIFQGVAAIAGAAFLQIPQQPRIAIYDGLGQALDARAGEQGFKLFKNNRLQHALNLHLQRPPGHEEQVRNTLGVLDHRIQQPVESFSIIHNCT